VLQLFLFGTVRILHDDREPSVHPTRAVQSLLAYLLLQPSYSSTRDELVEVFWGDSGTERGRSCLNTALWRLRQALEPREVPTGSVLDTHAPDEVRILMGDGCWADVAEFERCAASLLTRSPQPIPLRELELLERNLALHSGDLLSGYYDEWAVRERDRLRCLYLDASARLMGCYVASHAAEQAIACGRRILRYDPLREDVHRQLMQLYASNGQRALALQQYSACSDTLKAELNIDPMPETKALHQRILTHPMTQAPEVAPSIEHGQQGHHLADSGMDVRAVLQQMNAAMHLLSSALDQLNCTMKLLSQHVEGGGVCGSDSTERVG
jgi:DNA-binding SARP family transcriptional activator